MRLDQRIERLDAFDAHEVVKLLAGVREVLAQIGVDLDAAFFEFGVQQLGNQWCAAAASRARLGAAADRAERGGAVGDGVDNGALGDVVAGADLRAVGQRVDSPGRHATAVALRQDQGVRVLRQGEFIEHRLQQHAVVGSVPDQDRTQQLLPGLVDDDALVDPHPLVDVRIGARAAGPAVGVPDATDVDAEQLQLGAHVGTVEGRIAVPGQDVCGHLGHLVAGCDQAEDPPVVEGAFADGEDVRVRRPAGFVDDNAAALARRQSTVAGQFVARADAGREDHHIGLQAVAVRELHAVAGGLSGDDAQGVLAGVHGDAQVLDHAAQHRAAAVVQLRAHEARRELHDVRGEGHVLQRIGCFETEQAATNDDTDFRTVAGRLDRVEVFDGAVDVAVRPLAPVDGRYERIGAGGQDQRVVVEQATLVSAYGLRLAVDLGRALADVDRRRRWRVREREVARVGTREVIAQVNAVVGGARLLAEHRDRHARDGCGEFHEAVADHAVADDEDAPV